MKRQTIKILSDLENDQKKIEYLRQDDNSKITELYSQYRKDFFLYIKGRFGLADDTIYDIYQDSFMALYENVKKGKLTDLTGSLKTYLFGIGTNTANKHCDNNKRIITKESLDAYDLEDDQSDLEWLKKDVVIWKAVNELEDPCYTILSLCYWEHKKMDEIAKKMNYGSEQYARNRKSSCRKYLVEKLKKIFELDK